MSKPGPGDFVRTALCAVGIVAGILIGASGEGRHMILGISIGVIAVLLGFYPLYRR